MTEEHAKEIPTKPELNLLDKLAGTLYDTSEKELIISLATLFSLFQLMDPLAEEYRLVVMQSPGGVIKMLALTYGLIAIASLIAAFSTHIAARAFWIGLLGLRSVFPTGAGKHKPSGPLVTAFNEKHLPEIDNMIVIADRIGSLIFSLGAAIAILMSYFSITILVLAGLVWPFRDWVPYEWAAIFILLSFGCSQMALGFIDFYYKKYPDRLDPDSKITRFWQRGYAFFFYLGGSVFYAPIFTVFFTNISLKKTIFFMFFFIFCAFGIFFGTILHEPVHHRVVEHAWFNMDEPPVVSPFFYENRRPKTSKRHLTHPMVHTDVVKDPYLKLFLPVKGRAFKYVKENCPEMQSLEDAKDEEAVAARQSIIACMNTYFAITLDGEVIEPDLHFHQNVDTGMPGFLAYLPVRQLDEGKHILKIVRGFSENPTEYIIPFWK